MMFLRLNDRVKVGVEGFNLKGRALARFLEFLLEWKAKGSVGIDLSMCSELAYEVKTKKQ